MQRAPMCRVSQLPTDLEFQKPVSNSQPGAGVTILPLDLSPGDTLPGAVFARRGGILGNTLTRFGLVSALFVLLTAVIFWPWVAHLHTALIGPPEDNMNDFWDSWYAVTGHNPSHFFFTNLLRFPEGTPLIYQSFAYPQVLTLVVLSRFFGSDIHTLVALQNITVLASFPLAGVGAFYLVRHLVGSTIGGLIGGFVFAFNPSHVAQVAHHAGVASVEFLPFFVLAYLLGLEKRSVLWIGVAAAFYALSALSCWYYLFYGAYFMGFQLLYQRLRDHAWPHGWPLQAPLLCILSAIAMLSPLILPMVAASNPSVYVGGGNLFVADLFSWVTFPPEHMLAPISHGLYRRFSGNPWEATTYLGFVNLALLGWLLLRKGLKREPLNVYVLFGMLTFAVFASGETLHIAGAATILHLPDIVLDRLPFFANVRTPSRAVVFVYLFLSVGVGVAVSDLWRQRRSLLPAGAAILIVLILLDFYPAHLQSTPVVRPPGLAVLDTDAEQGFGVLNLPFSYSAENSYMLEQTFHHRPIVDGITAREMAATLVYRLSFTDLSRQRKQLAQAHVKYILLHHPSHGLYAWNSVLAPVGKYLRAYPSVYDGRDMTVLRVY